MSTYLLLKWLHIVSATILIGTGSGVAFFQWFTYRQGNVAAIAVVTRLVVRADFIFTASAAFMLLASGFLLMQMLSLPWTSTWALLNLTLFALAGACWRSIVADPLRQARLALQADKNRVGLPKEFHHAIRV
jgi:uncharacterized membrane protein